jgi:hypothetical protein
MKKLFVIITAAVFLSSCRNSHSPADVQAAMQTDTTVTLLWRENRYDAQLQDTFSAILINEAYCNTMTDAQRAAVGYVATFVGSECDWDGRENADQSNLSCKLLSALRLGYQCSEQHLGFLRNWFRNDTTVLKDLQDCPLIPYTASVQQTFDEMKLSAKGDSISLWFTVDGVNMKTGDRWHYMEQDLFQAKQDELFLLQTNHSDFQKAKLNTP